MKRSLIALTLAVATGAAFAANFGEYQGKSNDTDINSLELGEAGLWQFKSNEQDHGIQLGDAYRFNAGEQDEHMPKVG